MQMRPVPKNPPVAEFSRDMVETMMTYFEAYADEGVLKVEVTSWGLWLPNKVTGGRQFLGLARMPEDTPRQ
ncbi:hypothetical protein [Paracoccus tibetensis]|uniref:Uncharacterized protein n=1 Tax=Paracoccus tibetensis TaxID=336292 RepID=A0A1G5HQJ2_9RHOB|nr:hypothetical protein [Paracoccus tibetensis]SCY66152.1 hypothetical protein SAMN05660710_02250 [Paracoccus tibetensis]